MTKLSIVLAALLAAPAVALTAGAQAYFETSFSSGIPRGCTLVNGDGEPFAADIYANMGNDRDAAWVTGNLPGMGRSALSPTHCDKPGTIQDNLMILPPMQIEDTDAIIRFDARSLHYHLTEAYSVLARRSADEAWQTIYCNDAENHFWTTRVVGLSDFAGSNVELAFRAETRQGFILALDNLFVGKPESPVLAFENESDHYVGVTEENVVRGHLCNYGAPAADLTLRLTGFGEDMTQSVASIGTGEYLPIDWEISPACGELYDYTVSVDGIDAPLAKDFMSCSHFARTQVIDRGSGTWCNNCPMMGNTTSRLQRLYGDQLVVVETHIGTIDRLVCRTYNAAWIDGNVFNIPTLIPNHNLSEMVDKLADNNNFSSALARETIASISAEASIYGDDCVRINADVKFAELTDNSSDRYRTAYLLLGDFHDPDKNSFRQVCSAISFTSGEWYYQPDVIQAEMMYYDNVPVENASVAYSGVPHSLPESLQPGETYTDSYRLKAENFTGNALHLLAMVIDSETGHVLNARYADIKDMTGLPGVTDEREDRTGAETQYFDLTGRRLDSPSGLCIERSGTTGKVILRK